MLRALPLVAALVLAPSVLGQDVSDKRLRKAWAYLHPHEQVDVLEWWRLELQQVDNLLLRVLRSVVEAQEVDPGLWPEDGPLNWFDPDVHAPAQPIRRKWVRSSDRRAKRLLDDFTAGPDERDPKVIWRYDWGAGEPRRRAQELTSDERFENALLGFPPDLGLARALVLHQLDRGEERKALFAFGHAYTDRKGKAYPAITLYDAWGSGEQFETPDVDALGIVHTVLDDWRTWKAPVSAQDQLELYQRIGALFQRARRYRALREAVAETFLIADPVPRDGYGEAYAEFHALWVRHQVDPKRMRAALPDAETWGGFMRDLQGTYKNEGALRRAGAERRRQLEHSGRQVRRVFEAVLREFGALDRRRLPKLPPARKTDKKR